MYMQPDVPTLFSINDFIIFGKDGVMRKTHSSNGFVKTVFNDSQRSIDDLPAKRAKIGIFTNLLGRPYISHVGIVLDRNGRNYSIHIVKSIKENEDGTVKFFDRSHVCYLKIDATYIDFYQKLFTKLDDICDNYDREQFWENIKNTLSFDDKYFNLHTNRFLKKIKNNNKLIYKEIDGYQVTAKSEDDFTKLNNCLKIKIDVIKNNTWYNISTKKIINNCTKNLVYGVIHGMQLCAESQTELDELDSKKN